MSRLVPVTSYLSILGNIFLGFYLMFSISRDVGVDAYGMFVILKSTAGFFSGVLSFRTGEAVTKFCKTEEINGRGGVAKCAVAFGVLIDAIVAFSLIFLLWVGADLLGEHLLGDRSLSGLMVLFGLTSFFACIRGAVIGFFQSEDKIISINVLVLLECVLIVGAVFVSTLSAGGLSLEDVVYIHVGVYGLVSCFFLLLFVVRFHSKFDGVPYVIDFEMIRAYLKFSLKTFFSSTLKAGNQNLDSLVLAYFMTPASVGVYQAVKKVFSVVQVISQPWSMISYARLVEFYSRGELDKFVRYLLKITSVMFFVVLFSSALLLMFEARMLELMGVSKGNVGVALGAMLAIGFVSSVVVWWSRVFSNVVNPNYSIIANALNFILIIVLMLPLVYFFELNGAALSFMLINIMLMVYWFLQINKHPFALIERMKVQKKCCEGK